MTNKFFSFLAGFSLFFILSSCSEKQGCMDSSASNYDPTATAEDGSCDFSADGYRQANYTEIFHKVYGGSGYNEDELASGMVSDAAGNSYFNLNTSSSGINHNILIGRINIDGSLAWAKEWDGNYEDSSPDAGEHAETGGTSHSISIDADGFIYVVGQTAKEAQNNLFSLLVLKINPNDGSLVWEKIWNHDWAASGATVGAMSSSGYAIDATGDYLYITGATAANEIPLLALDKTHGGLIYEKMINLVSGASDKAYSLKSDANGNLFLGANSEANAYLIKINAVNTTNPTLDWVKKVDMGFAARFNSMDIDETGIYLSCNRRGPSAFLSIIKLSNDGSLVWGKRFPGLGEHNNAHCVSVSGSSVYLGGRTAQSALDDNQGDGLLLKLSKADGTLEWSGLYYTGKSDEESAEHRIKGISVVGNEVIIAGQVYGSVNNTNHFAGTWMSKKFILVDYTPGISTATPNSYTNPLGNSDLRAATGNYDNANPNYILQNAIAKKVTTPPDSDFFITKLILQ